MCMCAWIQLTLLIRSNFTKRLTIRFSIAIQDAMTGILCLSNELEFFTRYYCYWNAKWWSLNNLKEYNVGDTVFLWIKWVILWWILSSSKVSFPRLELNRMYLLNLCLFCIIFILCKNIQIILKQIFFFLKKKFFF